MARILIVDDESSIRITLREFLRDAHYDVDVAEDADKALTLLTAKDVDVVLTDIILPRITGVSLLKAIKAASPHVQVILMTGEPTVETASEAVRESACDYLTKPIGKEQLLKTVANATRIKTLDDERRRLLEDNRRHRENLEQLVEERTAALRESEERYRAVAEDTPVLICRFQPGGEIVFVNRAYCEYFEKTSEELVGSSFLALIPAVDRETVMANIKALTADSPTQSHEHAVIAPGGEIRWQRWTNHALFDTEGNVVTYQAIGEDITERKRAEEEKRTAEAGLRHAQKMDAVGQLASGVAHEFNNLLVGIRGNAEMLLNTSKDLVSEQSRRALEDIERAGASAHALTSQLLSFSRKKSANVTVFDVNRVVTDSKRMFVKPLGAGITLNTAASADPAIICADEFEVVQILLNLVLNARDAMPHGGTITIRTRVVMCDDRDVPEERQAGRYVEMSVIDDGCGMSPETSERIFEPFFTTKPVGEGTGLGLSVAYSDVSKHGGFLAVDSHEGVGTTVSVFLPHVPDSVVDAPAETPSPPSDYVGGGETILVCDDEDIVRDSVSALLMNVGYSVIAVACAADALAAAEAHDGKISLLLTDVTMPGMSGIELGREIQRRYPDMKILYSSGYAADDIAAGDDVEVLLKGGPSRELLQRVRQLLDEGKPSRAEVAADAAGG